MDIYPIIYKEQFRLKLGFTYLLASGWAIAFLAVIVLMDMSIDKASSIYLFGMVIIYKYLFGLTRDGYYYEPFFYKRFAKLMSTIRKRA
jgi:hypothetical protein